MEEMGAGRGFQTRGLQQHKGKRAAVHIWRYPAVSQSSSIRRHHILQPPMRSKILEQMYTVKYKIHARAHTHTHAHVHTDFLSDTHYLRVRANWKESLGFAIINPVYGRMATTNRENAFTAKPQMLRARKSKRVSFGLWG